MARIAITIMILFMAIGPIAHGYLAYKFSAVQTLSPEEETHDEKPVGKAKSYGNDQYLLSLEFHQYTSAGHLKTAHIEQLIILSKGYAGTPLMPPEVNRS